MQSRLACTLVSQANLSDLGKRAELGKTLAEHNISIVNPATDMRPGRMLADRT